MQKLIETICEITGKPQTDAAEIVKQLGLTGHESGFLNGCGRIVLDHNTRNLICDKLDMQLDALDRLINDEAMNKRINGMFDAQQVPPEAHEYSVCFLFNENLTHVLLQRKLKTDFAGLLNGIGGSQRQNETKFQGALREIREETGVCPEDITNFGHLGTLTLPYDCKTQTETPCILHYFTGAIRQNKPSPQPGEPELLEWHNVEYVRNTPVSLAEKHFAGNGDLQYFVHMAVQYHNKHRTLDAMHELKKTEE